MKNVPSYKETIKQCMSDAFRCDGIPLWYANSLHFPDFKMSEQAIYNEFYTIKYYVHRSSIFYYNKLRLKLIKNGNFNKSSSRSTKISNSQ